MNCKKGDMALIIKSYAGDTGKVVTCLEYAGKVYGWCGDDLWLIDVSLPCDDGSSGHHTRDEWLMPIGKKHKDKNLTKNLTLTQ